MNEHAVIQSWREHWFVINVLAEIPIIGSYFKFKDLKHALHDAGKCVAALAGGTTAMMTVLQPTAADSMATHVAKTTASMIIGMSAGKVVYNGINNGGTILYHYLAQSRESSIGITNDAEMEAINTNPNQNQINPPSIV